jgi:hypothetical protein
MLVDNARGIQVYTYEGRPVSNPNPPTLRPQYLRAGNISLSNDCVAIIDRATPAQVPSFLSCCLAHTENQVLFLDATSGKQIAEPFKHNLDVVEVRICCSCARSSFWLPTFNFSQPARWH